MHDVMIQTIRLLASTSVSIMIVVLTLITFMHGLHFINGESSFLISHSSYCPLESIKSGHAQTTVWHWSCRRFHRMSWYWCYITSSAALLVSGRNHFLGCNLPHGNGTTLGHFSWGEDRSWNSYSSYVGLVYYFVPKILPAIIKPLKA